MKRTIERQRRSHLLALPFFCPKIPLTWLKFSLMPNVLARFISDIFAAQFHTAGKIIGLPGQSEAKLGRLKPLGSDARQIVDNRRRCAADAQTPNNS